MTEAQWLSNAKTTVPVMDWLRRLGSDRQFWLAGAAAVRNIWHLIPDERSRQAVEVAERFADGLASPEDMTRAFHAASAACPIRGQPPRRREQQEDDAYRAATYSVWTQPGACSAAMNVLFYATKSGKRAERYAWQAAMLRDIIGNPFRPKPAIDPAWRTWNDATVVKLAQRMYDSRDFTAMPILADALEEAGCTSGELLDHCRQPGVHVRGCWVVDLVLGRD